MPNVGEQFVSLRFIGGVNLNDDARLVAPNTLSKCKNMISEITGRLRKRDGSSTFSTGILWNDESEGLVSSTVLLPRGGLTRLFFGTPGGDVTAQRTARRILSLNAFPSSNDNINSDLMVGALGFTEGPIFPVSDTLHDAPFYVDPEDGKIVIVEHANGLFDTVGAQRWQFANPGHIGELGGEGVLQIGRAHV